MPSIVALCLSIREAVAGRRVTSVRRVSNPLNFETFDSLVGRQVDVQATTVLIPGEDASAKQALAAVVTAGGHPDRAHQPGAGALDQWGGGRRVASFLAAEAPGNVTATL